MFGRELHELAKQIWTFRASPYRPAACEMAAPERPDTSPHSRLSRMRCERGSVDVVLPASGVAARRSDWRVVVPVALGAAACLHLRASGAPRPGWAHHKAVPKQEQ